MPGRRVLSFNLTAQVAESAGPRPITLATARSPRSVIRTAWSKKQAGTWAAGSAPNSHLSQGGIVAQEHWCSSAFANTDLDLLLKRHGIHQLIVIGLIAHTCVESTVRFAVELGYDVTLVKDATADYSDREMEAALEVNIPNYASAIVTTDEIVDAISALSTIGVGAGR